MLFLLHEQFLLQPPAPCSSSPWELLCELQWLTWSFLVLLYLSWLICLSLASQGEMQQGRYPPGLWPQGFALLAPFLLHHASGKWNFGLVTGTSLWSSASSPDCLRLCCLLSEVIHVIPTAWTCCSRALWVLAELFWGMRVWVGLPQPRAWPRLFLMCQLAHEVGYALEGMREGRSFRRLSFVSKPSWSWQWFMHSAVTRTSGCPDHDFPWFTFFPWARWRVLLLWPQSVAADFPIPTVSSLSQNPLLWNESAVSLPDLYEPYGWVPVGLLALLAAWPLVATGFSAKIFEINFHWAICDLMASCLPSLRSCRHDVLTMVFNVLAFISKMDGWEVAYHSNSPKWDGEALLCQRSWGVVSVQGKGQIPLIIEDKVKTMAWLAETPCEPLAPSLVFLPDVCLWVDGGKTSGIWVYYCILQQYWKNQCVYSDLNDTFTRLTNFCGQGEAVALLFLSVF